MFEGKTHQNKQTLIICTQRSLPHRHSTCSSCKLRKLFRKSLAFETPETPATSGTPIFCRGRSESSTSGVEMESYSSWLLTLSWKTQKKQENLWNFKVWPHEKVEYLKGTTLRILTTKNWLFWGPYPCTTPKKQRNLTPQKNKSCSQSTHPEAAKKQSQATTKHLIHFHHLKKPPRYWLRGWTFSHQKTVLQRHSVDGSEIPRPTTVWMVLKPCFMLPSNQYHLLLSTLKVQLDQTKNRFLWWSMGRFRLSDPVGKLGQGDFLGGFKGLQVTLSKGLHPGQST